MLERMRWIRACFSGNMAIVTEESEGMQPGDGSSSNDSSQSLEDQSVLIHSISVDELKEITDNFGPKALIYGRVYHGVLKSGQTVAIKKLTTTKETDCKALSRVAALARLNHVNVVKVIGYCIDQSIRALAYEFAPMGSLRDLLHGREGGEPGALLSWAERVKIAIGAARGIRYLHEKAQTSVIHGGIKSSNVLLFDDCAPKISDLDLANQEPDDRSMLYSSCTFGTFAYDSPEYALNGQLTSKSDVYSFGVVLLELLTGRKPVNRTLPLGQQSLLAWARSKFSEGNFGECLDPRLECRVPLGEVTKMAKIVAACVRCEPESRPSMKVVLRNLESLQQTGTGLM